jgi:archaellum component FlaC
LDFTTQINTISEVLNSLTARIEGIEKTVAAQSFAKVEDLESIKEVVTKTYAVVEGLVNTPAATVENKFSTNKRADKINELRNLLNN